MENPDSNDGVPSQARPQLYRLAEEKMTRGTGKYEALYLSDPCVCGNPFPEFVAFADGCTAGAAPFSTSVAARDAMRSYSPERASVLSEWTPLLLPAMVTFFERAERCWTFQEGLKPSFLFATLTNTHSEQIAEPGS